jgi:hypothetical protein
MRFIALAAVLSGVAARPASAAVASEWRVYSPTIETAKREVEFIGLHAGPRREQGYAVAAGYGFAPGWAAELYEIFRRDPDGPLIASSAEFELRHAFGSPGEYAADFGMLGEISLSQRRAEGGDVRIAPLIEKQRGPWIATVNLPLEWQYGPGYSPGTHVAYAARLLRLVTPLASPAIEAYGEPGAAARLPALRDQEHALGPAVDGSVRLGVGRRIHYSAAGLFGLTAASARWTVVTRLEFEF